MKSKSRTAKREATAKADAVVRKLAKAHGKTPAEVRLAAAQAFARANAAEAERLRQQLADTVREAAADTSALAQQVTTAKMWTRYERRKRQQEQVQHDREMAKLARAKLLENQQPVQAAHTTGDKLPPAPPGMEWVKMRIAKKRLGCSEATIGRRVKAGVIGYHKTNPKQSRSGAWYAVPIRQQPGT